MIIIIVKKNMNLNIRLTCENASLYIGRQILYKTRGFYKINKILKVFDKSIQVKNGDLYNNLQLVTRKIYVLPE